MQLAYMTIQALAGACRQSAQQSSVIRVAALAQPLPGVGRWIVMRGNWDDEPARLVEWRNGLAQATSNGAKTRCAESIDRTARCCCA